MDEDKAYKVTTKVEAKRLIRPEMRGTWIECIDIDPENEEIDQFLAPKQTYCLVYVGGQLVGNPLCDDVHREFSKDAIKAGVRLVYILQTGEIRCGLPASDLPIKDAHGCGFAARLNIAIDEREVARFYEQVTNRPMKYSYYQLSNLVRESMRSTLTEDFKEMTTSELEDREELLSQISMALNDAGREDALPSLGLSVESMKIVETKIVH
jgi:hypothetical protein